MNVHAALKSQYHAALKTLRDTIEKCPPELWNDTQNRMPVFWRVAYHTLYFTHFYMHQRQEDYVRWLKHREEANYISSVPPDHKPPQTSHPYTKEELLEYWTICDAAVDSLVDALGLSATQCGFPWYQMPTLEHQLVNLRHIQHHTAILSNRLRLYAGIKIDWVGKG